MEQARISGDKYRVAVLGRTRNALAPIAQALRAAKIPFRSVDLEKLSARPEVLDALALARALLNPIDRVAWLGILRAPWCGLSLADLHTLTSADNPELLPAPFPNYSPNASNSSATTAAKPRARPRSPRRRARPALRPAHRLARHLAPAGLAASWRRPMRRSHRPRQPRPPLAESRQPPQRRTGPARPRARRALENLTAQPDPETSSDCGVQFMTIHKSKGLEFEVVIVPELQAGSSRGKPRMLSWLERGLPPEDTACDPDGSPEDHRISRRASPIQRRRPRLNQAVGRSRLSRARIAGNPPHPLRSRHPRPRRAPPLRPPRLQADKNGDWTLAEPKDSLLATAWPALADRNPQALCEWREETAITEPEGRTGIGRSSNPSPPQPKAIFS